MRGLFGHSCHISYVNVSLLHWNNWNFEVYSGVANFSPSIFANRETTLQLETTPLGILLPTNFGLFPVLVAVKADESQFMQSHIKCV